MDTDGTEIGLTLAHSSDSDDAFMFWALREGRVRVDGLRFEHVLSDIQSLNQAALEGRYDISAISLHAFAYIARNYALLNAGASVGDGYGPIIVSARPLDLNDLPRHSVAIPGSLTTAALVLRLAVPGIRTEEMAFDQIAQSVKQGEVSAGVIIHEGQITFESDGLHCVTDLGSWWRDETGLPLPLGANVVRRSLGREVGEKVCDGIRRSILYAEENRVEAINYAKVYSRKLVHDKVDRFVSMYVNDYSLDWGPRGRKAVEELLRRGAEAGIVPEVDMLEFVG